MRRTYNSFNSFSRFVPILLVIIITIVTIVAIISISRSIFGGDEQKQQQETTEQKKSDLLQTDESRAVRLTVRGPIVANEKFRSYQITIAPSSRVMTTYEGYVEKQLNTKQLNNNTKAYEELVYALDKRKMMEGRQLSDDQNDLRGICATGKVYKFELLMNGTSIKALWTSDCSGSKGSAVANVEEIVDMFIKQIPDGSKMATSIGLYQRDTLFKF